MKKLSTLILTVAMAIAPVSVHASDVDEHWQAPKSTVSDQLGVVFDDRVDYFYIGALTGAVNDGGWKSKVCTSLADAKCASASFFSFKAMLNPCLTGTDINCIASVVASRADGSKVEGKFARFVTLDKSTYWTGDVSAGLPNSSSESLWTFADLNHSAGSEFMVSSILDGTYKRGQGAKFGRLQTVIQPVSEVRDADVNRVRAMDTELNFLTQRDIDNEVAWTGGQKGSAEKNCAAVDEGICFKREPFPSGTKYSVKIRLSSSIGGWIHGRMKTPEVSITGSGQLWNVEVTGEPIAVPVMAYWGNRSELSNELQSVYVKKAGTIFGISSGGTSIRYQTNGQFNQEQINLFSLWIPLVKDKSNAIPKMWMYGSLTADNFAGASSSLGSAKECVTKASGLAGLVTTNATIYDGTMPSFDSAEGVLNYKVSAPHYAPDGSEFLGTYDLIMKSEVARCIYKFTAAPVSATVSVTSSDGTVQKIATTVLNERNGWMHLGAYGFTFSSPTVRVKLTQAVEAAPTSSPSASTKPSAIKKSLITCVKGKTTKKVTAVKPKCPTGYKKR